jgi:hypothetical protein
VVAEGAGYVSGRPHEWVAIVPYNLDDMQARFAMSGGLMKITLRPEMARWDDLPPVGCFVCEQPWTEAHDKPCPGEPPGRLEYVR